MKKIYLLLSITCLSYSYCLASQEEQQNKPSNFKKPHGIPLSQLVENNFILEKKALTKEEVQSILDHAHIKIQQLIKKKQEQDNKRGKNG